MNDVMNSRADTVCALLDEAMAAYQCWHGSQVWIYHPLTCKGTREIYDIHRDAAKLDEALTGIGAYLRERLQLPPDFVRDGIDHSLGSAVFQCYHGGMI